MNVVQSSLVQSQVDLIKLVCEELGAVEKADEVVEKLLGNQLKLLKSKKTKAPKDPNRIKKPKNAYMFYSEDMRPKVTKEHPEEKIGGIAKIIGAMWKELTDKQKKKYQDMHVAAMVEYNKAVGK